MDRFREMAVDKKFPFLRAICEVTKFGLSRVDLRIRTIHDILADRDHPDLPREFWRERHERIFLIGKVADDVYEFGRVSKVPTDPGVYILDTQTSQFFPVAVQHDYSHPGALELALECVQAEYALFCVWAQWEIAPITESFTAYLQGEQIKAAQELEDQLLKARQVGRRA